MNIVVPEWGDIRLRLRSLTVADRSVIARKVDELEKAGTIGEIAVWYVILSAVDDNGNRRFTDADATWLKTKRHSVIDRIAQQVRQLSFFTDDEAKKNSTTPTSQAA
jgi:hypothetical protein